MPQPQPQQTRTMLVIINPVEGSLQITAQPANTRGLALIDLCHQAIADYDERQRVLDAVAQAPAGQYQQLGQALKQAEEQHSAAKETLSIIVSRLTEHFHMIEPDPDESDENAGQPEDAEPANDDFPAAESVDITAIAKKNQSRFLSKPIPWIVITVTYDDVLNRPSDYGKAMTKLLDDANSMLVSHDAIIKPKRRNRKSAPAEPSATPDQAIADNLMSTAEQTIARFIAKALAANW